MKGTKNPGFFTGKPGVLYWKTRVYRGEWCRGEGKTTLWWKMVAQNDVTVRRHPSHINVPGHYARPCIRNDNVL